MLYPPDFIWRRQWRRQSRTWAQWFVVKRASVKSSQVKVRVHTRCGCALRAFEILVTHFSHCLSSSPRRSTLVLRSITRTWRVSSERSDTSDFPIQTMKHSLNPTETSFLNFCTIEILKCGKLHFQTFSDTPLKTRLIEGYFSKGSEAAV